ncbi:probable E3 ubiquitin ligase SUD1 [Amaranthus tricolor]|uniref:probable E3 ubiquitin ligase SUD1 n=1 Tax=Amaranthus tricolor TaxID=29722 RepID=UPI00258D8099|nr:probable E3 ubiquitin ligase SUD1 [Amaranthus tricolor]
MIDSSEVKIEDQDEERESSGDSSEFSVMATSSSSVARNVFDDDDKDEDVCRICRNPGEADNPLRYPCACSGSIKFVHQDCLLQWLNHSNARQCEGKFESAPKLRVFLNTLICLRVITKA